MVESVPGGCDRGVGNVEGVPLRRSPDRPIQRLARCVVGLALFGPGLRMFVPAEPGRAGGEFSLRGTPRPTGVSLGWVIEIVGCLLLLLWIPLRQRPGVGTIMNALEGGLVGNLIGHHSAP